MIYGQVGVDLIIFHDVDHHTPSRGKNFSAIDPLQSRPLERLHILIIAVAGSEL